MLTLLKNAEVFAPEPLGKTDLLIGGDKLLAVGPGLSFPSAEQVDLRGQRVVPGLIDGHVHVTGGGGESGPASRVPPITAKMLLEAGITTVIGLLGTDSTTRSIESLVARTLGLREEGLSAWCYTGSYALPVRTLTGTVRGDITFIDPIIGVGELAISDHRSSQPTLDELLRVASDVHVAGLQSGKAGVLHLHLGDGPRGLDLVRRALETELPPRCFHPTHVNRQRRLFDEAVELTKRGCSIDVTAFPSDDEGYSAEEAIERYTGDPTKLTISSDGCGCLPTFNAQGEMIHMDVGKPSALSDTLKRLLERGKRLEAVLPFFTSNVAQLLRLRHKGRIASGMDADLTVLDDRGGIIDVWARGRRGGKRA